VDTQPSEENLSFEEKVSVYVLGGAGLLVWAVVMLFLLSGRRSPSSVEGSLPPVVYAYASTTATGENAGPLIATPTPLPTFTPTPIPSPTLTPIPTTIPSGVSMLPIDGDIRVIALLGIDEQQDASVWRTDSIMLAFVDPRAKRVSLLSIPRDLWVRIPGYASNRINTVDALGERAGYPGGGAALLDKTLRYNLGVPVHHYVRIDFSGFVRVVDALGGVTVDVKHPLTDNFPDPMSPSGWAWITLPAGPYHMDGRLALRYCRSRVTTSDFDRAARQQQVLLALGQKTLTFEALARAPQLWAEFNGAFQTDLTMTEAIQLAYFVQGIGVDQVHSMHLDYRMTRDWTTPEGAQVLLPQTEDIRRAILDLVSPAE
jgi:LCP family protein required for cell wall assembly